MRILLCAALVVGCGPAATPAAAPVQNEQPGEIIDEQPSLAVVVIVDRSGSMQGAKLDNARLGAHAIADTLPDDAMFAMIVFDSEASALVKLQPARHRDEISAGIDTVTPGGGTNYLPGLQLAADMLEAVSAARKVVVFLSDGEAAYDGVTDVIATMHDRDGVQTTTIGLAGADRNLLSMMADAGAGSLFMVEDPAMMPKVMRKALEAPSGE